MKQPAYLSMKQPIAQPAKCSPKKKKDYKLQTTNPNFGYPARAPPYLSCPPSPPAPQESYFFLICSGVFESSVFVCLERIHCFSFSYPLFYFRAGYLCLLPFSRFLRLSLPPRFLLYAFPNFSSPRQRVSQSLLSI